MAQIHSHTTHTETLKTQEGRGKEDTSFHTKCSKIPLNVENQNEPLNALKAHPLPQHQNAIRNVLGPTHTWPDSNPTPVTQSIAFNH